MAKAPKLNTPGPLETALMEQVKAGAWYVYVETYHDLAHLQAEVFGQYDRKWTAVTDHIRPPPWADIMFHGLPLVVGKRMYHGDQLIAAIQLLRDLVKTEGNLDLDMRRRVEGWLTEQMVLP